MATGLAVAAAVLTTACGAATAQRLPDVRIDYNEAVARSSSEQLLLNLVRLRYLHAPQFFEVASVTTQSSVSTDGSLGVDVNAGLPPDRSFAPVAVPSVGVGVRVTETPTVSYTPLRGPDFAARLVRPIRASTVAVLIQVGWRIDRLLACCVSRINDLPAPVIASRDRRFGGQRFQHLAALLYDLQIHQSLEIDVVRPADEDAPPEVYLTLAPLPGNARLAALAQEVRELLGLAAGGRSFRVLSADEPLPDDPRLAPPPGPDPGSGRRGSQAAPPTSALDEDESEGAATAGDGDAPEGPEPQRPPTEGPPEDALVDPGPADTPAMPAGVPTPDQAPRHRIIVRGRSLLGALVYLSHGVVVPEGDRAARSLDYPGPDGEVRVPNPVPEPLLRVALHRQEPSGAYISTSYRGLWFTVEDSDLESKQVFLLLNILFSVLSGEAQGAPVLTLPAGG
ncbi:MAG: hypothetical protein ACFCGT_23180 [Sandaracinaceae bacterium]